MAIADAFDAFLIDLDGVVYIGENLVPGSDEAVRDLFRRGKRVVFLTNNPENSRRHYAAKLGGFGLDVEPSAVLTAGAATAQWIARHEVEAGTSTFVVGSEALKDEVRDAGLEVVEGERGREADVVVVGGHGALDYAELRIASQAVRRGAAFYATGRDATFPMPDGSWPATGAIVAAIETASGHRAHAIGKPEPEMFRVAIEMLDSTARTVVVGDRLDSDIEGGRRAGLATVLVLTGTSSEAAASIADPAPDFVVPDLKSLVTDP